MRIFIYDGKELPDPDEKMSVDEVRQQFTDFFPELANAETKTSKRGQDDVYTFAKRVGTKGSQTCGGWYQDFNETKGNGEEVEVREVFASKDTNNLHGYIEFKLPGGSSAVDASLLHRAGDWVIKHPDYTLLAVNLSYYPDADGDLFGTGTMLRLFVEG